MGKLLCAALCALAACNKPGAAGVDGGGGDGGNAASCHVCTVAGGAWCTASQSCVERSGPDSCDWGRIDHDSSCDDPGLATQSRLPLDCRRPALADDVHCKSSSNAPPKSVGKGPNDNFYAYGGGFIDAAHDRLVVAFACDLCTQRDTGVMGIDLTTGDRTLLSGKIEDPLTGSLSVGTGDALTSIDDVELAPNGRWWVLDSHNGAAMIHEIDPATGNRTAVVVPQEALSAQTGICKVKGIPLLVGSDAAGESFTSGLANIVVHSDGKIYMRAERAFDPSQREIDLYAIVELDHGACRIVTAYSSKDATLNVGTGPAVRDDFGWLAERNGKLVTNVSYYFLHEIDLATGNRVMLASSAPEALLGTGGNFGGAFNQVTKDGGTILATGNYVSHVYGGIVAIDASTGNRTTHTPAAGPQRNGDDANPIAHPTLDGAYVMPGLGMVTLYEPFTGNSMYLSR